MWEKIVEIARGLLRFVDDAQQNRRILETLEKRLLELASETEREDTKLQRADDMLAFEVQRLRDELQRQQASEAAERRILKLELENHLLRQERGLPPAQPETPPQPEIVPPTPNETDQT